MNYSLPDETQAIHPDAPQQTPAEPDEVETEEEVPVVPGLEFKEDEEQDIDELIHTVPAPRTIPPPEEA